MTNLPLGWCKAKIEEVLQPHENGKPFQQGWSPQCEERPSENNVWGVLRTTAIQEGEFLPHENKSLPRALEPRPHLQVKPGDILMTCAGPRNRCGVTCFVKATRSKLMISGKMYRFRPDLRKVTPQYLEAFLHSRDAKFAIDKMKTGISDSGLNLTHARFAELILPLPPLNEQGRIMTKVEELMSELDKGVESLRTTQEQLKVYRQSVLTRAFEGELTAKWRDLNKDKLRSQDQLLARLKKEREAHYQKELADWKSITRNRKADSPDGSRSMQPRPPKGIANLPDGVRSSLPAIPDTWLWEKLGWMTCGVEYGTAAKSSGAGSVPVIRMGNLQNAVIDWEDLVYTSDVNEIEKYRLVGGDVLFNRTNSPELVGKTAIYRGERPAIFAGYLIRINHFDAVVDSQYLNLFLNSHLAKKYGNSVKTDGVNQSNINGEKLQSYPFPYCSLAEQIEIVRILDERISLADRLIEDIDAQLKKSTALRQSILKKAFSGQLVAQDPHDEPASVVLEKIKGEKAKEAKRRTNKKAREFT
jgi:type I restriction enzyme S subunit